MIIRNGRSFMVDMPNYATERMKQLHFTSFGDESN